MERPRCGSSVAKSTRRGNGRIKTYMIGKILINLDSFRSVLCFLRHLGWLNAEQN